MFFYVLLSLVITYLWWRWIAKDNLKESDLAGKYVFVTGCDSGFGKEAALTFDKKGFRVIAGCLTEKGRAELQAAASNQLQTVLLNVTDKDNVKSVAESIKRKVGERGEWQNNWTVT